MDIRSNVECRSVSNAYISYNVHKYRANVVYHIHQEMANDTNNQFRIVQSKSSRYVSQRVYNLFELFDRYFRMTIREYNPLNRHLNDVSISDVFVPKDYLLNHSIVHLLIPFDHWHYLINDFLRSIDHFDDHLKIEIVFIQKSKFSLSFLTIKIMNKIFLLITAIDCTSLENFRWI